MRLLFRCAPHIRIHDSVACVDQNWIGKAFQRWSQWILDRDKDGFCQQGVDCYSDMKDQMSLASDDDWNLLALNGMTITYMHRVRKKNNNDDGDLCWRGLNVRRKVICQRQRQDRYRHSRNCKLEKQLLFAFVLRFMYLSFRILSPLALFHQHFPPIYQFNHNHFYECLDTCSLHQIKQKTSGFSLLLGWEIMWDWLKQGEILKRFIDIQGCPRSASRF